MFCFLRRYPQSPKISRQKIEGYCKELGYRGVQIQSYTIWIYDLTLMQVFLKVNWDARTKQNLFGNSSSHFDLRWCCLMMQTKTKQGNFRFFFQSKFQARSKQIFWSLKFKTCEKIFNILDWQPHPLPIIFANAFPIKFVKMWSIQFVKIFKIKFIWTNLFEPLKPLYQESCSQCV